jgi:hypothetical protein
MKQGKSRKTQTEEPVEPSAEAIPIPDAVEFQIGSHAILLPPNHGLDQIKRRWHRYDRPLSEICASIAGGKGDVRVIDIGANVGDSAALICSEENTSVLSIEGNPAFLPYLRHNSKRIGPRVTVEPSFIGNAGGQVVATLRVRTTPISR